MNCPKCNGSISEGAQFCPECGAAIVAAPEPVARGARQEGAAQIEVSQQIETVEGGRVVGVDLGEVLGDVNIGNYTLRIGTLNGGVVNLAPPEHTSAPPQPRPVPVMLLPRAFSGFLDRTEEVSAATAVLEGASPVEFHGPPGVGKTTLLHYLAHYKFAPVFPAGVVFFSEIRNRPVDDLLLDFFDAFYERDPSHLPTSVQLRHALKDEHALVVLDDVDLEREEVEALMDAAPTCVFLSAATERRLWSGGRTIALPGLPSEEALALIERELGHPLGEDDRLIVQQLYAALEGYPLRLLQLGALVRDDGISLGEVAERLQQHTRSAADTFTEQTLAERSEFERRVLAALAVPMGASIGEEHLNELAGVADARPVLESLQRRQLVQAHSPRYSLAGSLDEALREGWDLAPFNERAVEYFATWTEEQRQAPDRVLEEADAIIGVLRRAAQEGRWQAALRLGRAVEGALAVRGRWGAWAQTLEWELEAARQIGDRAAEAWCLHQSGTRALCLEDAPTARADLTEALRLRESLGDEEGAAVTRHNLNLLGGYGGDHGPDGNGSGGGTGGLGSWPLIAGTMIVLAILALLGVALWGGELDPLGTKSAQEEERPGGGGGGGGQRGGGGGEGQQDGGKGQNAQCVDGEDNDEDGHIDDADPSCAGSQDNEFPVGTPQCGDEEDNDGDGFLGLDDPRCASLLDDDESPFDSVRAQCADEKNNDEDGFVDLEDPSCADSQDDNEFPVETTTVDTPPQCGDGLDNDGDGFLDLDDPRCASLLDDESPVDTPQCANEEDDDRDGFLDLDDPRCASLLDDDESPFDEVPVVAQCGDEKDNDEDQYVDVLEDPNCADSEDDNERPVDSCPKGYSRREDASGSTSGPCKKDVE
jgi:hypothetical protein